MWGVLLTLISYVRQPTSLMPDDDDDVVEEEGVRDGHRTPFPGNHYRLARRSIFTFLVMAGYVLLLYFFGINIPVTLKSVSVCLHMLDT